LREAGARPHLFGRDAADLVEILEQLADERAVAIDRSAVARARRRAMAQLEADPGGGLACAAEDHRIAGVGVEEGARAVLLELDARVGLADLHEVGRGVAD